MRRCLICSDTTVEILLDITQAVKPMRGHCQRIADKKPPKRVPDAPCPHLGRIGKFHEIEPRWSAMTAQISWQIEPNAGACPTANIM
jgi:hypothetical protein